MKSLLIAAGAASFFFLAAASGQVACRARVEASVEVASGPFSLADLLAGDACPVLQQAAAGVRLGNAPLAGSVRVLQGNDVRILLESIARAKNGSSVSAVLEVPERITVRSAGARATCAEIGARMLANKSDPLKPASPDADMSPDSLRGIDCGAADRIPSEADLEFKRRLWDPVLASWEVTARCVHREDCVPFWVRVPSGDFMAAIAPAQSSNPVTLAAPHGVPLVHAGDAVTLLWDQDGIRMTARAICLDRGGQGDAVRARVVHGGSVVRAIVVDAGSLRAAA